MPAQAGQVIAGKYRLEKRIGVGGMAQVWKAEHEALGRTVAIKFLDVGGPTSEVRTERFLREARLAAMIHHRHVVQVIDYGTAEHGEPYMVMEHLEGTTLAERLREEPPLTDADVVGIVAQVASGLAAVHEAGIVHRDVKPDNVFVVDDGDGPFAKLLDFGVSKGFGDGATRQKLTSTGAVVGTPHYMSPEQARGVRDLDLRSDLFSLGVVLYEALTGTLPFDAENPGDILIQIVTRGATPIDELRPDLPEALALAVERAMAKEREARFATARGMREALLATLPSLSRSTPVTRAAYRPLSTTGSVEVAAERASATLTLESSGAGPPSGAPDEARLATIDIRLPTSRAPLYAAGVAALGLAALGLVLGLRAEPEASLPRAEPAPVAPASPPVPRAADSRPAADGLPTRTLRVETVAPLAPVDGSTVPPPRRPPRAARPDSARAPSRASARPSDAPSDEPRPRATREAPSRPARSPAAQPGYFEELDY